MDYCSLGFTRDVHSGKNMNVKKFCIILSTMVCIFLLSCTKSQNEIPLPKIDIVSRIPFVAWYTTDTIETPMQGVLRFSGTEDALQAERMGLAFVQGSTLGICHWQEDGPQCIPSNIPKASSLLEATRAVLTRLMCQRGFSIHKGKRDTALLLSCLPDAEDTVGPIQLTCRLKSGAHVTVQLENIQETY